jgi:hypothetical protein
MKILLLAGSLFLASLSYAAEPWQEPEDFRGLKFGASVEEMKAVFGNVLPVPAPAIVGTPRIKTFALRGKEKIGAAEVTLGFGFLDDRFAQVYIMFKSADFSTIRGAFMTRYGEPHSVQSTNLKTTMGAEYTNEKLIWKGPTLEIELQKYSGKITDGMAQIMKHELKEEQFRAYRQKQKEGAKDL